jgi:hypothetical protein
MSTLQSFESGLEAIVGRPTTLRPFVCDGSPLDCRVFIVGFNPATESEVDFWIFWSSDRGFDRALWYQNYLKERRERPLNPGKTRRPSISNTRRVMDWIEDEAPSMRFLETNIYSAATEQARDLAIERRITAAFDYLLREIRPLAVIAHGRDAVAHLQSKVEKERLIAVQHFARGWSEAKARELGRRISREFGNG